PPQIEQSIPKKATSSRSLSEGLLPTTTETPSATSEASGFDFEEIATDRGLTFHFENGDSEQKLMPSATSGGLGWIDYDRDGWADLFIPQGGELPWSGESTGASDSLFRSHSSQWFTDSTVSSGVIDRGYGHGVSVADYDNDGFPDVYVSNVGPDVLLHNNGDGTFTDCSEFCRPLNTRWSASSAFGDIDNDGDLDIYVCNYVDYAPEHPVACVDEQGKPSTCHPKDVGEIKNCCYRNEGNGLFTEVADELGLNAPGSKSLGVLILDVDRDGSQDVYVANDTEGNHLFINGGSNGFSETGVGRGCATSGLGHKQASMGLAASDYDHDGWIDIYVTHFVDDSNTLYRNLGHGVFADETRSNGLHSSTFAFLGFGVVFQDFDCDGRDDCFIANGHIDDWRDRTGDPWKMSSQLFRGLDIGWVDVSSASGPPFQEKHLGRGVAVSDFDHDGDADIAVLNQNENVSLLMNKSAQGHWSQVALIGTKSNRDGLGSYFSANGTESPFVRCVFGGGSYCSASDYSMILGYGSGTLSSASVAWPLGHSTSMDDLSTGHRYVFLEDGRVYELCD
ncbi:MAG: VCBS repeat-containing protein, partial [Planctomycetaceae bacterium]|nr:VCBS repeat-containing protein [Planctomycetaceae bacterium]